LPLEKDFHLYIPEWNLYYLYQSLNRPFGSEKDIYKYSRWKKRKNLIYLLFILRIKYEIH